MRPQFVIENEAMISKILIDNKMGHLVDHLGDGPLVRQQIRERKDYLERTSRFTISKELRMIYDLYPSNGAIFRKGLGISKRAYNRARNVKFEQGWNLEEALKVLKKERKLRKQLATKARQEKHRRAVAARGGKKK